MYDCTVWIQTIWNMVLYKVSINVNEQGKMCRLDMQKMTLESKAKFSKTFDLYYPCNSSGYDTNM